MYQGKIQETGSVADVFNNPQSDYTKALIAAETEEAHLLSLPIPRPLFMPA